jgi:hypothetical protein
MMLMLMMMRGLLPWPPIHYPSPLLLHRTRKPQGQMPPWPKLKKKKKKTPSYEIASFTPPHPTTNPISATTTTTTTTHETNIQTDKDSFV